MQNSETLSNLASGAGRRRRFHSPGTGGWILPPQKTRAIKWHEFGLQLSADDKQALIAFLKTL